MSNPKHDKGEHYLATPKAEPFLERLIFAADGVSGL